MQSEKTAAKMSHVDNNGATHHVRPTLMQAIIDRVKNSVRCQLSAGSYQLSAIGSRDNRHVSHNLAHGRPPQVVRPVRPHAPRKRKKRTEPRDLPVAAEVLEDRTLLTPVALDDSYGADAGSTLEVDPDGVLGNDWYEEGGPLTAQLVDQPSNGDLTLDSDGSFLYTPDSGFEGQDQFTYLVSDGVAGTDSAVVTIEVGFGEGGDPAPGGDGPVGVSIVGDKNRDDDSQDECSCECS